MTHGQADEVHTLTGPLVPCLRDPRVSQLNVEVNTAGGKVSS